MSVTDDYDDDDLTLLQALHVFQLLTFQEQRMFACRRVIICVIYTWILLHMGCAQSSAFSFLPGASRSCRLCYGPRRKLSQKHRGDDVC